MQNKYQVSKWLYNRSLLSVNELMKLLEDLENPFFFLNGQVVSETELHFSSEKFIECYKKYLDSLASGENCVFPPLIMTRDKNSVEAIEVREGKYLIKPLEPVIQIREHCFVIGIDEVIHSMVYGKSAIRWGLQFAYPQLYVDPATKKVLEILKETRFKNTQLFKQLQKWMRYQTKPVTLKISEKKINATFRIGRELEALHHADLNREKVTL